MVGWLDHWAKRIKITIDHNDIDAALTDFPHLIHIGESSGYNNKDLTCVFDELKSDANRKKIAVTTGDGITQCYVEIDGWDHENKKAWLWVKIPHVDPDEDTVLYLYYGLYIQKEPDWMKRARAERSLQYDQIRKDMSL